MEIITFLCTNSGLFRIFNFRKSRQMLFRCNGIETGMNMNNMRYFCNEGYDLYIQRCKVWKL